MTFAKLFLHLFSKTKGVFIKSCWDVDWFSGIASLLFQLILYPEKLPYESIRLRMVGMEIVGLLRVRRISSAYRFNLKSYPWMFTPWMFLLERMAHASGSRAIMKSKGLTGHPCRTPRCKGNGFEIIPLVLTEEIGELYRVLTQLINLGPNPKRSSV